MSSAELTENLVSDLELKQLAERIHSKGLATPALFLLEMYKPLMGVLAAVSQSMHPLLFPLFSNQDYKTLVRLLENRELLEKFLCELEQQLAATGPRDKTHS